MLTLFNLVTYATGNGFWVFVGVAILMSILVTGAVEIANGFLSIFKR